MDAQLKKGILEMCILHAIEKEAVYGYTIIQSLHASFPDVAESTFYAVLRRLNREGAASVFEGPVSRGPTRKYYRLTGEGKARLQRMKAEWKALQAAVEAMGL